MSRGSDQLRQGAPPLSIHAWLRQASINRLLRTITAEATLLEIGAGQGSCGAILSRRFDYLGVEPDAEAFAVAAERMRRYGKGSVRKTTVEDLDVGYGFDVVCAFEVLEHIENDSAALRSWVQRARPGGTVLVSVPANPNRFAATDEHAGHYRRYSRATLTSTMEAAGLAVETVAAYGFPIGYALEAARNQIASRRTHADELQERTAASGRWLQPGTHLAPFTRLAAAPWIAFQRPFASTELGTGLVARGRRIG